MGFFFARAIHVINYTRPKWGSAAFPRHKLFFSPRFSTLTTYYHLPCHPFGRERSDDVASTSKWHLKVPADDE